METVSEYDFWSDSDWQNKCRTDTYLDHIASHHANRYRRRTGGHWICQANQALFRAKIPSNSSPAKTRQSFFIWLGFLFLFLELFC